MTSRFIFVGIVAAASAMAMGCNSSSSPAPTQEPGVTPQPQSGPAWTLSLKSTCLNAAQDQCLAKYGFSVSADGKYQVGPGPQGQVRAGSLSDAEFAAIKPQIEAVMAATTENHESDVANVSDDSMTLTRQGTTERVVAHNTAGEFYFTTASSEEAKSLHTAIRDLANGYYHLPFGDACGDAADKITAAATEMASCQSDSDCVYIDAYRSFSVVPPQSVQWLLTEDCSAVIPPVVANKLTIVGGAQTLEDLYATARTSCGAEYNQSYFGRQCQYQQKATSVQPTCVQNRCQARL